MADAGADILVAHIGLTTKGAIGAQTSLTLEKSAERIQKIADSGKKVNPDVMVIYHDGPVAEPEDAEYIFNNTDGVVGFFGASSIERLPTEQGIRQQTEQFKNLTI